MKYELVITFATDADTPEEAAKKIAEGLKHDQYQMLTFEVHDPVQYHIVDVDMNEV